MAELLRPTQLEEIASSAQRAKREKERELARTSEQKAAELRDAFLAREIQSDAIDRINKAIRIAAEQGLHQAEIVTFPCRYCNDGGRRINIADPEWPQSLEGFAKKAFDFYQKELRPLGFKMHAEIISFPEGRPGEAALYLKW